MAAALEITILGLSITSSWGNGHATTYRALLRALAQRGHAVRFLERDVPWYADHRDLPDLPYCRTLLYGSLEELFDRYAGLIRRSDLVVVGSFVPDGADVAGWVLRTARGVRAFYDIDTPVTLERLARGDCEYLAPEQVAEFDLYLSFTGGATLRRLEREYGCRVARPLYCSADPDAYHPEAAPPEFDLGYLGTYSADRQPGLDALLLEPARRWPAGRFAVHGPMYPESLQWPRNVQRRVHSAPAEHRRFYNRQRFTLNVTRQAMVRAGHAPSVRLFEAAACGTPVVSDAWPGLDEFFHVGREILVATAAEQVLVYAREMPESTRLRIGQAARARVLAQHTARHRAAELEKYLEQARARTHPSAAIAEGMA